MYGADTPELKSSISSFRICTPIELRHLRSCRKNDVSNGVNIYGIHWYRCLFFWLLGPAFIGNFLLLSVRSALRGKFYFPSSSRSRADVSRLLPECLRVSDRASRVPSLSIEPCIMILIVVVVNLTKKLIFGSTGGKLSDL